MSLEPPNFYLCRPCTPTDPYFHYLFINKLSRDSYQNIQVYKLNKTALQSNIKTIGNFIPNISSVPSKVMDIQYP